MDNLLTIILSKMHSLDGNLNTSLPLENFMSQKKGVNMEEVHHVIVRKTLFKFKILRIRMKISYIAFEKRMTVP